MDSSLEKVLVLAQELSLDCVSAEALLSEILVFLEEIPESEKSKHLKEKINDFLSK